MTAHIGGLPIEETVSAGGPALLTALAVAAAKLRMWRQRGRRDPPVR
jgi:hypothetical protein